MTANAFTSVSLEPPLVLVCVAHSANTHRFVTQRPVFGVNVLAQGQEAVAAYYARKVEERSGPLPARQVKTPGGRSRLEGCLAFLGCRVVGAHEYGDHTIFVAEVEEVQSQPGKPLLYFQRKYRGLAST
jgi:flavin reductase (DIM6/NTAB) family NADH-FMN oxidoreductase RutF